jgi:hypothetical protein
MGGRTGNVNGLWLAEYDLQDVSSRPVYLVGRQAKQTDRKHTTSAMPCLKQIAPEPDFKSTQLRCNSQAAPLRRRAANRAQLLTSGLVSHHSQGDDRVQHGRGQPL